MLPILTPGSTRPSADACAWYPRSVPPPLLQLGVTAYTSSEFSTACDNLQASNLHLCSLLPLMLSALGLHSC